MDDGPCAQAGTLNGESITTGSARLLSVLGVLEHCDWRLAETTAVAVALADQHRARLTLVKTTARGWHTAFQTGAPFAMAVPIEPHEVLCHRALGLAVAQVPPWISLTTLLLPPQTTHALEDLLRGAYFDAVVASARLLRRPRIRTELERLGVQPLVPRKFGALDPRERAAAAREEATRRMTPVT